MEQIQERVQQQLEMLAFGAFLLGAFVSCAIMFVVTRLRMALGLLGTKNTSAINKLNKRLTDVEQEIAENRADSNTRNAQLDMKLRLVEMETRGIDRTTHTEEEVEGRRG